jgi:hypothetical protein
MSDYQPYSFPFKSFIDRLKTELSISVRQIEIQSGLSNGRIGKGSNTTLETLEKIISAFPKSRNWLIELLDHERSPLVEEPEQTYGIYKDKYIDALEQLNSCRQQKEAVEKENELLKKFGSGTERESKLKKG